MTKPRLFPPEWVTARGREYVAQWRRGVEFELMQEPFKRRAFEKMPIPAHIKPKQKKRMRGWWAKFDTYGDNPYKACIDEGEELAAAKAACNRLTADARKAGAKVSSTKAAQVRAILLRDFHNEIASAPPRGVSKLAKTLAPILGLGVSTMRSHIVVVKDLLTSR